MKANVALKHYRVDRSTGCWVWTGSFNFGGYGWASILRKKTTMHRYFYEHYKGSASGLFVCHRCNNKQCVNPDHLYAGTPKQNAQDAVAAGAWPHGENHGHATITEDIAVRIIRSTGTDASVAKAFGLCRKHIGDIRRGRKWKEVYKRICGDAPPPKRRRGPAPSAAGSQQPPCVDPSPMSGTTETTRGGFF